MTAIGKLKTASFVGISFPYTECKFSISVRKHEHVYIHTNGGELEKLGLALRKVSFTIPAHDTLNAPWQNFYSQILPKLWEKWQSLITGPLIVPSVGTIQAMATEATRTIRQYTSGEPVEVSYLEDSKTLATIAAIFTPSVDSLPVQARAVLAPLRAAPASVPAGLLDRVEAAVRDVVQLTALGTVAARQLEARISHVVKLCEEVCDLPVMGLAVNWPVRDLLLDLILTTITLRADAQRRGRPVFTWPTLAPARMTVSQLAAWVYGDTARATELLALNDWDPLNVPPGSVVRYYA